MAGRKTMSINTNSAPVFDWNALSAPVKGVRQSQRIVKEVPKRIADYVDEAVAAGESAEFTLDLGSVDMASEFVRLMKAAGNIREPRVTVYITNIDVTVNEKDEKIKTPTSTCVWHVGKYAPRGGQKKIVNAEGVTEEVDADDDDEDDSE